MNAAMKSVFTLTEHQVTMWRRVSEREQSEAAGDTETEFFQGVLKEQTLYLNVTFLAK